MVALLCSWVIFPRSGLPNLELISNVRETGKTQRDFNDEWTRLRQEATARQT